MRGWYAALAYLAVGATSCYSPTVQEGLPCSVGRECPDGLACSESDDRCYSTLPDAAVPTIDAFDAAGPRADVEVGSEEVLVPAGEFLRGCNMAIDTQCNADESPSKMVFVSAFYIDKREITLQEYQFCVDAGPCPPFGLEDEVAMYPDTPAATVSWDMAVTYCDWHGKRLPTEAEWEKAARGTEGFIYPWGNTPAADCAHAEIAGCTGNPIDVGSLPDGASPYGVLDMVGNVHEWCADWYGEDYYVEPTPATDPTGPAGPEADRVIRGGSYSLTSGWTYRTSMRGGIPPDSTEFGDVGIRCARSP